MKPDYPLIHAGITIFFTGVSTLLLTVIIVFIAKIRIDEDEYPIAFGVIGAIFAAILIIAGASMWGSGAAH